MRGAVIETVEMHTGGEPVRIIVAGYPELAGATLLDKRRDARERFDHYRRRLMLEPRGHADMYGALVLPPDDPSADLAVLFMHNEGYSTMCGHATIALARWAVDSGRVVLRRPTTEVRLQCPCGLVRADVAIDANGRCGDVTFESVAAFAFSRDRVVVTETWGPVLLDIAYGGAFYAYLPADTLGLDVRETPMADLVAAADAVTRAAAAQIPLAHPQADDLAFLYGTILTDGGEGNGAPSLNLCVFADRQVDRSPTGSGVTGRIALEVARGTIAVGQSRVYESITGARFGARPVTLTRCGPHRAVTVAVSGRAYHTGEARFRWEDDDPLAEGFRLRR